MSIKALVSVPTVMRGMTVPCLMLGSLVVPCPVSRVSSGTGPPRQPVVLRSPSRAERLARAWAAPRWGPGRTVLSRVGAQRLARARARAGRVPSDDAAVPVWKSVPVSPSGRSATDGLASTSPRLMVRCGDWVALCPLRKSQAPARAAEDAAPSLPASCSAHARVFVAPSPIRCSVVVRAEAPPCSTSPSRLARRSRFAVSYGRCRAAGARSTPTTCQLRPSGLLHPGPLGSAPHRAAEPLSGRFGERAGGGTRRITTGIATFDPVRRAGGSATSSTGSTSDG
jgi:hypothetical protein